MINLFLARGSFNRPTARRSPRLWTRLVFALCVAAPSLGAVVVYEGDTFPEEVGWARVPAGVPHGERALTDGWLIQTVREGEQDDYWFDFGVHRPQLLGRFFMEWRTVTDYPEWLIHEWQAPAVVAAGGMGGVLYHTVMTESAGVFLRDIFIPRVIVPIALGDAHTYRVEVLSDVYLWYIDDLLVDSGVPEGPYPDPSAGISWGVDGYDGMMNTTAWDYVRFGRIPDDASGDYDSDGGVGLFDYYFVHDCLTKDGPGIFAGPEQNAGPGCRFTDFDADADTDLFDFAAFQTLFTAELD